MIGQRAEPLAAVYPQTACDDLIAALTSDEFSLQPLVHDLVQRNKLRTLQVSENKARLYKNVNQLEDLASN